MNAFFSELCQDMSEDLEELFNDMLCFLKEVKDHGLDLKALLFLAYIALVETLKKLKLSSMVSFKRLLQSLKSYLLCFLKLFGLGMSSQFIYWLGMTAWASYFGYGYGPHHLFSSQCWVWDIYLMAGFTLFNSMLCHSVLFVWFWLPFSYSLVVLFRHKPNLFCKLVSKGLYSNMMFIQFMMLTAMGAWLMMYFSYYDTHNLHYLTFGPTIYYAERVFM